MTNLTEQELEEIRLRVISAIETIELGQFQEYEGSAGLHKLADAIEACGRKRLSQRNTKR